MRILFENEQDPILTRIKNHAVFVDVAQDILKQIGFEYEDRRLKCSTNLFPCERPTVYYNVASALGDIEWIIHTDASITPPPDLQRYWGCYQPHLLMGDVERVMTMPAPNFTNLTHIVVESASPNILGFARRYGAKLFHLSLARNCSSWNLTHVE